MFWEGLKGPHHFSCFCQSVSRLGHIPVLYMETSESHLLRFREFLERSEFILLGVKFPSEELSVKEPRLEIWRTLI